MHSATLTSSPPPIAISSSNFTTPSKCTPQIRLNHRKRYPIKLLPISLKCTQSPFPKSYDYDYSPTIISPIQTSSKNVAQKLQYLVTEFKSLTQPIDRVKRLLDYATRLPFFDESARSKENRVTGCTAQLWLEVTMDLEGSMRFKVDSDSEITKGFCSCLIWLLDGAAPEEVVAVKAEDLAEMNVGILPANSRVNTWNTVLISMKKRTKALVAETFTQPPPLEPLPCLVASTLSDTAARGSFEEAKV